MRLVAGDDADGREADSGAVEIDAAGLDRLVEIAADAGIGDGPLGIGDGEVVERLLDAGRAIVEGVIIGEGEQIEAGVDQRLERGRVAPEMERAFALALGREVVAVGDDGFEIDEGKIAVHVGGDASEQIRERGELPPLAEPVGIDLGVARVEAGIADQHDGHAVEGR